MELDASTTQDQQQQQQQQHQQPALRIPTEAGPPNVGAETMQDQSVVLTEEQKSLANRVEALRQYALSRYKGQEIKRGIDPTDLEASFDEVLQEQPEDIRAEMETYLPGTLQFGEKGILLECKMRMFITNTGTARHDYHEVEDEELRKKCVEAQGRYPFLCVSLLVDGRDFDLLGRENFDVVVVTQNEPYEIDQITTHNPKIHKYAYNPYAIKVDKWSKMILLSGGWCPFYNAGSDFEDPDNPTGPKKRAGECAFIDVFLWTEGYKMGTPTQLQQREFRKCVMRDAFQHIKKRLPAKKAALRAKQQSIDAQIAEIVQKEHLDKLKEVPVMSDEKADEVARTLRENFEKFEQTHHEEDTPMEEK